MGELSISEIEMLKYIKRRKSVSPKRLRLNFPICFNRMTGKLFSKGFIIQEYAPDDKMFYEDTLMTMPGSGNYTLTIAGQDYLDKYQKRPISKVINIIKCLFMFFITSLAGYLLTILFDKIIPH